MEIKVKKCAFRMEDECSKRNKSVCYIMVHKVRYQTLDLDPHRTTLWYAFLTI